MHVNGSNDTMATIRETDVGIVGTLALRLL